MTLAHEFRPWLRRTAGWLWLCAWLVLLYCVCEPWTELGGLVSERLRWLEWFVLCAGSILGFTLGLCGRDALAGGGGQTYGRLLRLLLYPPALLTATVLLLLVYTARTDPIGVAFTGFLSYWAGVDVAFSALPLMNGNSPRSGQPDHEGIERFTEARRPYG